MLLSLDKEESAEGGLMKVVLMRILVKSRLLMEQVLRIMSSGWDGIEDGIVVQGSQVILAFLAKKLASGGKGVYYCAQGSIERFVNALDAKIGAGHEVEAVGIMRVSKGASGMGSDVDK